MPDQGAPSNALHVAAQSFDATQFAEDLEHYAVERAELLARFPLQQWPEMTLLQYAQGTPQSPDAYCTWLERKAIHVGSIRGGSARKLLVYKHGTKEGWYFPKQFSNEEEAWLAIRAAFVRALELAEEGRWGDIDALDVLGPGSVAVKTLHVYFPDEVLPITSTAHLRHFLTVAARPDARGSALALNRELLALLRAVPELDDVDTKSLERLLYSRFPPDAGPTVLKVSPGEQAHNWEACLASGQIRVGWPDVGDLTEYDSLNDLKQGFQDAYPGDDDRTASGLLKLRDLKPGDLVVANRGLSEVLAVGTVKEPGYTFSLETDGAYPHIVPVGWDVTQAKTIPKQHGWRRTIVEVPARLQRVILAETEPAISDEPLFERIAAALERKGQLILYGPPGTGKTYTARRFADWWSAELTTVTFHPSYGYEDFVEGFRPTAGPGGEAQLRVRDGVFKRLCGKAADNPARRYVLLIDEINRGNVAKILGELISLLEADKRGTLKVELPQSGDVFTVPPNLYLVATMNTADRSIRLLDAALRRRFAFLELLPDPELLAGEPIADLSLDTFLAALNAAIAELAGREKQIGHSYFFRRDGARIETVAELAVAVREEIIPLLQEYAYEDYGKLAQYLGEDLVDVERRALMPDAYDDDKLLVALAKRFAADDDEPEPA
jgi:5-methylcytosine-specific restriction protein B